MTLSARKRWCGRAAVVARRLYRNTFRSPGSGTYHLHQRYRSVSRIKTFSIVIVMSLVKYNTIYILKRMLLQTNKQKSIRTLRANASSWLRRQWVNTVYNAKKILFSKPAQCSTSRQDSRIQAVQITQWRSLRRSNTGASLWYANITRELTDHISYALAVK